MAQDYKQFLKDLISELRKPQQAQIFEAQTTNPFQIQKFSLDLSTATTEQAPFEIKFPFKAIWFKNANTGAASLNVKFNKNDTSISRVAVTNNDIIKSNSFFSAAFLDWSAQSATTIDVYVFIDAEVFSGSLISANTVTIANPSTFTVTNPTTLTGATAGLLFSSNSNVKKRTIENNSGQTIWLGGSGVTNSGATTGLAIPSGQLYETTNTGALYAYSATAITAGVSGVTCVEES